MAITDELLNTVKLSLSILDNSSDAVIRQKIVEAIDYLKAQGVSDNQMQTDLATAAITLYVNDFWTVGGKIEESPAFWNLVSRLYSNSRAEDIDCHCETKCEVCNCRNEKQNDHAKLINLEFENSKHTGFASSEDISISNLLFMAIENNNPILTTQMPTTNQVLLPMRWFAAEPETWQDVLTLTPSASIGSQFFEIIQNNRFSAKLFLNSDVARTGARVRIQLIDTTDNEILATAVQIVDLPSMNVINVPISFEGFYQSLRRVQLSNIRLVISVMTSLFGFQIRLISNPPNEISFISKTSTTALTEEQIRDMIYNVLGR